MGYVAQALLREGVTLVLQKQKNPLPTQHCNAWVEEQGKEKLMSGPLSTSSLAPEKSTIAGS